MQNIALVESLEERLYDLPTFSDPMPKSSYDQAQASGLSKVAVYGFAEQLANQLDFTPGDDIDSLVRRIGGKVKMQNTLFDDPEKSGSLLVHAADHFEIIVPAHTSPTRDRFTIAHELGHYFLHYLWRKRSVPTMSDQMIALRKGSDRVEWEANWFAAGFLMPEKVFKKAFKQHSGSVSAIAREFEVSQQAVEVRISQLGLS